LTSRPTLGRGGLTGDGTVARNKRAGRAASGDDLSSDAGRVAALLLERSRGKGKEWLKNRSGGAGNKLA